MFRPRDLRTRGSELSVSGPSQARLRSHRIASAADDRNGRVHKTTYTGHQCDFVAVMSIFGSLGKAKLPCPVHPLTWRRGLQLWILIIPYYSVGIQFSMVSIVQAQRWEAGGSGKPPAIPTG
ncbi:hypothetical protein PV04_00600 [Phialophora macrospora]|uniref:Uncharacterized protein n=1 Tax=Phialophora macrospora TaxID=1851006 RepID=A0A0D2FV93_9EURO|nr:hypothetical protein PV04_00600 [Phialophora macrospora]